MFLADSPARSSQSSYGRWATTLSTEAEAGRAPEKMKNTYHHSQRERSAIRQLDQKLHDRVGDLAHHLNVNKEVNKMPGIWAQNTSKRRDLSSASPRRPCLPGTEGPGQREGALSDGAVTQIKLGRRRAGRSEGLRGSGQHLPSWRISLAEIRLDVLHRIKRTKEALKPECPDTLPQAEVWQSGREQKLWRPASSKERAPSSP